MQQSMTLPATNDQVGTIARATVLASERGRALVRLDTIAAEECAGGTAPRAAQPERWAVLARGVEAEAGDRAAVLLADEAGGEPSIVIAAHGPARPDAMAREGTTSLIAEEGDLELGAPNGSVVIRAGTLVRVEGPMVDVASGSSTRIACGTGGTQMLMQPGVIETKAGELRSRAKRLRLLAERLEAEGDRIDARFERGQLGGGSWRLDAKDLAIGAADLAIDVANTIQQKAGRVRTVVAGVLSVTAGRTRLRSKGRTSIDGEQIHLG
mgnify:CR=1 FL=1